MSDSEIENFSIKTLNDLSATFKRCLNSFGIKGYFSIQEKNGGWQQDIKYIPINVHAADLLTVDEIDDQSFDETILAQHSYLNMYNIWEGLIRDAVAEGLVEITPHQLPRIFRPVLGDHGRSLIHHLSSNYFKKLSQML